MIGKKSSPPAGQRLLVGLAAASVVMTAAMKPLQANIEGFQLQGTGTLRWMGLKIYDARLFTPHRLDPQQLAKQPFALELTYARDFSGNSIAERSMDEIKRLGMGSASQRQAWYLRMQALFPDVKAGDRIRGVYRPGEGALFFHNDNPIGSINDIDFARAFFAIWLDPKTAKPSLRKELLGLSPSAQP